MNLLAGVQYLRSCDYSERFCSLLSFVVAADVVAARVTFPER